MLPMSSAVSVAHHPLILFVKIAQFLSLFYVSISFVCVMSLLPIKFPIRIGKITVTLQKIGTIKFLYTGCLTSIIYFSFKTKVNILSGQEYHLPNILHLLLEYHLPKL